MTRSSMKFNGDTTLTHVPDDTSIEVNNGTLTVDCVMGKNVRITQRGSGNVVINAKTGWNANIKTDGNVQAVTTVYKTRIRAGGNIDVKYGTYNGSDLSAPNGTITIGKDVGENSRLNAKTVKIGGTIGENCTVRASKIIGGSHIGAGSIIDGTAPKNGFVGKLLGRSSDAQQGLG